MFQDTRTHVVVELYETEKSYVDALDILVKVRYFLVAEHVTLVSLDVIQVQEIVLEIVQEVVGSLNK